MVFSGSGRHRRPTQADKAVATATVVGAGLALPLLTATGAHAAQPATWDTVAQCETVGNWVADAGDGFYGGLHLTLRQWLTYGGDQYASVPSHATREQQIAVAERMLADLGPTAWGACATVPGSLNPPVPTPPATPGTPSAPGTPSTPGTPTTPAPGADQTPAPSTPAPAQPSTPPAASAPAPTTASPTPTAPGTDPATPAPVPAAAPPSYAAPGTPSAPVTQPAPAAPADPAGPTDPAAPGGYTVQSGDTLSQIAYSHHLDGWTGLYQQNASVLGANPDLIYPGQHLQLP
ncbi:transglycosylase [Streptomyces tateyamensis]|uniref:Transglycosylase n=1 Tax=Streptomyces tateyamensis TaxID=565073 RepID=A0A2V4MYU1_9ACTN|nr:transglycosylase family protein [Streptomyces tateyamensis]PYC76371.1 transglycosylase [Streptomyces tateyamensis]